MSENIRNNIQSDVCRLLVKLNDFHSYGIPAEEVAAMRATLYHILDTLDRPESLEYLANRFERGSLQFFMEVN